MKNPYKVPPQDIRIRMSAGSKRGGRPRSGDGCRLLINRCRVKPETKAQLEAWLIDLQKFDETVRMGQMMDWLVEIMQKRSKKMLVDSAGRIS